MNNWDLVDSSAEWLVGEFLREAGHGGIRCSTGSRHPIRCGSAGLRCSRRSAFIKAGDPGPTLRLAPRLLDDREDLMHKAVGWMLREVGKRIDRGLLLDFLDARTPRGCRGRCSRTRPSTSRPASAGRIAPDAECSGAGVAG